MNLRLIRSILGVMIIWTIVSVILLAVRCSDKPWYDISAAQCTTLVRDCNHKRNEANNRVLTLL